MKASVHKAALVAAVAGSAVLAAPSAAPAYDETARRYAVSKMPYWEVGRRDAELSRLCQLGSFNQKRIALLFISFVGEKGRGITGIAKQGFNLYDPGGEALPEATYHFYQDGTSSCQVFVSP